MLRLSAHVCFRKTPRKTCQIDALNAIIMLKLLSQLVNDISVLLISCYAKKRVAKAQPFVLLVFLILSYLAFGELETPARFALTVFLTLNNTRIAGQEASSFEGSAKLF